MESLGTGRKEAGRGRKRQDGDRKRQEEAFPLPAPVPSDSIAGPPKKVKRALASLPPLGSFYLFTFLPFYL